MFVVFLMRKMYHMDVSVSMENQRKPTWMIESETTRAYKNWRTRQE